MKSLFTFLALEIVTTDFCVTGFNEDPWGFSHTVEFSQNIFKDNTSEYSSLLYQSQAFRPSLIGVIEDKSDDVMCAKNQDPKT